MGSTDLEAAVCAEVTLLSFTGAVMLECSGTAVGIHRELVAETPVVAAGAAVTIVVDQAVLVQRAIGVPLASFNAVMTRTTVLIRRAVSVRAAANCAAICLVAVLIWQTVRCCVAGRTTSAAERVVGALIQELSGTAVVSTALARKAASA